jgi:hypothetical protein
MNMNNIRRKRVSLAILPMDTVLNPAVLAVTDWKKADKNRPGTGRGARVLCHSMATIKNIPETIKMAVVESTSLE